jgi:hypothetical protein
VPQLTVHIGGGKTGSSYLQSCFAALRQDLLSRNIHYPDADSLKVAAIGRTTSGNGHVFASFSYDPEKDPEAPKRLQASLLEAEGRHVLISSESLQFIVPEAAKRLRDTAEQSGYDMRVLYYVRSVAERAWSSYGQRVKRHAETRTFKEWLQSYFYPNGRTCQNLASVLPDKAIIVRNYDYARRDLWRDFAEAIGCPSLAEIEPPVFVVNRSLTAFEIAYKRIMNQVLKSEKAKILADEALCSLPAKVEPVVITPDELEVLTERCAPQLEAVNRHLPAERHIAILSGREIIGERPEYAVAPNDAILIQLIAYMLEILAKPR